MDPSTLNAYDREASDFADDWHAQPPPTDLHDAVRKYFVAGPTADIGCGSGRDTAWLDANGYPAVGYDASEGMLAEAGRRYPGIKFRRASLPDLAEIADGGFANILCETVIMHLDRDAITPAVERLLSLLAPCGVLYLTWRLTEGDDRRDERGRLYAAFDPDLVLQPLRRRAAILLDEQVGSVSSGKSIRRVIARLAA